MKWTDQAIAIATMILTGATIFLAFYTYCLFKDTQIVNQRNMKAVDAAIKSTEIARHAFEESRKNDSISWVNNQQRFIHDSLTMDLQIQSMRMAQNEFNTENNPYLQISNFNVDTIDLKRGVRYKLVIQNLGNYPVKVTDFLLVMTTRFSPFSIDSIARLFKQYPDVINQYIVKGTSYTRSMIFPISEDNYYVLTNFKAYIYTAGIIKYQNLITGGNGIYKFEIQSQPFIKEFNKFIVNENLDVKNG